MKETKFNSEYQEGTKEKTEETKDSKKMEFVNAPDGIMYPSWEAVEKVWDIEYAGKASEFLKDYLQDHNVDSLDEEDEMKKYHQVLKKELMNIAEKDKLKNLKPKDAAVVFGDLLKEMHIANPDVERNITGDSKLDKKREKDYQKSRKLFMESCKKVFTDDVGGIEDEKKGRISDIHIASKNLKKVEWTSQEISAFESSELFGKNPKELLKKIDEVIDGIDYTGQRAWKIVADEGSEISQEKSTKQLDQQWRKELADAAKEVYKLELMRDQLKEKIYGKKDISPADAKEIDNIREKINSSSRDTENMEGKKQKDSAPDSKTRENLKGKEKNIVETRKDVAFYINELHRNLNFQSELSSLNLGDDAGRWQEVADNLKKIYKRYNKDIEKMLTSAKIKDYEKEIKDLFETLRKENPRD